MTFSRQLSAEQIQQFQRDGFLILKGFYDLEQDIVPIQRGIHQVIGQVLKRHGWVWMKAPQFAGRKARCSDLTGVVIAKQAHHFVAVIDGVANDIWDCTHKMVYGYWAKA